MMNLYEIEGELGKLLEEYSTCEDEAQSEALFTRIQELDIEREKKLYGLCSAYKNCVAVMEMCAAERKRLAAKVERLERQADRIAGYLAYVLPPGAKWKAGVHEIGWRKSERVELKVEVEQLPDAYVRVKAEPNLSLLKEDLKLVGDEPGEIKRFAELKKMNNIQIR